MTREQALRKVMACLRMAQSGSANSQEAATALRHARVLMDQYGLTEIDLNEDVMGFFSAKTRYRGGELPTSLIALACVVDRMYGCMSIVRMRHGATEVTFGGPPAAAEVASYAFTVLRRMLERDRTQYLARVRKAKNRRERGELFASGWVRAVRDRLPPMDLTQEQTLTLERGFRAKFGEMESTTGKVIGKPSRSDAAIRDVLNGVLKGRQAHVAPGLGTSNSASDQLQLEHQA